MSRSRSCTSHCANEASNSPSVRSTPCWRLVRKPSRPRSPACSRRVWRSVRPSRSTTPARATWAGTATSPSSAARPSPGCDLRRTELRRNVHLAQELVASQKLGGPAHATRWRMRSARGGTLPALVRRSCRWARARSFSTYDGWPSCRGVRKPMRLLLSALPNQHRPRTMNLVVVQRHPEAAGLTQQVMQQPQARPHHRAPFVVP